MRPTHPRPVRVLHLITDLRVGGAELQLARLVDAMRAAPSPDVELVGVACLRSGGAVGDRIAALGIPVWTLGARGPVSFARALGRLRVRLAAERVDVVVAWLYHSMIAVALPGIAPRGARRVWNVRGTLPGSRDRLGTRLAVRACRMLGARAHAIVYNSETARREHEAIGYPVAPGAVIPNGYEAPSPSADVARRVSPAIALLAARFHPMKDFATFLRAVRLVIARGVPLRARLAGDGCVATNPELAALLDREGMREATELAGVQREMLPEYRAASVVVSSSAWGEGFQNVLAEAALAGTPVVSTDVGEARRIVMEPWALVPPGQPERLADAIERVLRMSAAEQAASGALGAARLREEFGVEQMRARYDALCLEQHAVSTLRSTWAALSVT